MKILDVGCGQCKYAGSPCDEVVGIDRVKLPVVDVVHDLNRFPYPFKESEFDLINCQDVLEHLDDVLKVMSELWRITKPGGSIHIRSVHFTSVYYPMDMTHRRAFTLESFDILDQLTPYGRRYGFYSDNRFKVLKKRIVMPRRLRLFEPLVNRFPDIYEHIIRMPPAENVIVQLQVIKQASG